MKKFLLAFVAIAVLYVADATFNNPPIVAPRASAASAAVTLATGGREIECDGTQQTATLNVRGGSIYNKSSASVYVDLNAGTVTTSSGSTSIEIAQGTSIKLPDQVASFTFKTAGSTSYLIYLSK